MHQQEITCKDGHPLSISLFEASRPEGVVIIGSALGVPQSYYRHFAKFLVEQNYHCITFSYRGTEKSISKNRNIPVNLEDWGAQDIESVIQFAIQITPNSSKNIPIHFIGHSIGGQLVGFARSSKSLRNIILVASSCPYWKRWSFPGNIKMLFASRILFPIIAFFSDEFPTQRVGLGNVKIPSRVAGQWSRWMSKPNYFFDKSFMLNIRHYSSITQPLLSLGFKDDDIVPEVNIQKLLSQFSNAKITHQMINPSDFNVDRIGHSGFFKEKLRSNLWKDIMSWIKTNN